MTLKVVTESTATSHMPWTLIDLSVEEHDQIAKQTYVAQKNYTLTSDMKMRFIFSSLKHYSSQCQGHLSMKLFFDIKYDGKELKQDYIFKAQENSVLIFEDLISLFQNALNDLQEKIQDDSGKNLRIDFTAFLKYPQNSFKSLTGCAWDSCVSEGLPRSVNDIGKAMDQFLMMNARPIESHLDKNLDFIYPA